MQRKSASKYDLIWVCSPDRVALKAMNILEKRSRSLRVYPRACSKDTLGRTAPHLHLH